MYICPNCSARLYRPADPRCWKCKADFGPGSAWKPTKAPPELETPFSKKVVKAGIYVAAFCPASLALGFMLLFLVPGCPVGSGGTPNGCKFLGIELGGLLQLLTMGGLVGSFLFVPLGLVICLGGAILSKSEAK